MHLHIPQPHNMPPCQLFNHQIKKTQKKKVPTDGFEPDFSSHLGHSALLINTIAIIPSSGRFSIHYITFISVTHTLHLNYYHMQSQYEYIGITVYR